MVFSFFVRLIARGAEADLYEVDWFGMRAVVKLRKPKRYRDPELDKAIRSRRTLNEVRVMAKAREAGVDVPAVYFFDVERAAIVMEYIDGPTAKDLLESGKNVLGDVGSMVARLHAAGIVHGDLALTNVIYRGGVRPYFIDMGLGYFVEGSGRRAVLEFARDVNVLLRVLDTYGERGEDYKRAFWDGYSALGRLAEDVREGVRRIRASARYVER
ncbi:Mn2+-dependent serine/threonine protein kinase [Thermoproteus uzoniensis 768-20]|uniref:non-specific serine/threonine protein kinase n=1 Tax=Thermoproteus uzoniensis (strain 768-20) TaxID=999630 RepID=F2L4S0_THEU7|nr:Mn2+-dependent serine/threonine protein kinase [Thermoproteus uzoniensis 768-20]